MPFEALSDVQQLLAHGCRRSGLTVRSTEHCNVIGRGSERSYCVDQPFHVRNDQFVADVFERQCVRKIVDVLRRAREVNKFDVRREFGKVSQLLLYEVLDGLYVVVGGALDRLDARAVSGSEIRLDPVNRLARRCAQRRKLVDRGFVGQMLEPAQLDADTVTLQPEFTNEFGESRKAVAISPVQR